MTRVVDDRGLQAAIDTVIPPDLWPGGWTGGVRDLLEGPNARLVDWARVPLQRAADALQQAAMATFGRGFDELDGAARQPIFAELLGVDSTAADLAVVMRIAFEGFYAGSRAPSGWAMVGYQPVPDGVVPVFEAPPAMTPLAAVAESYDAVVVGAGAGGGVAACVLAEAGVRVQSIGRQRIPMRSCAWTT